MDDGNVPSFLFYKVKIKLAHFPFTASETELNYYQ